MRRHPHQPQPNESRLGGISVSTQSEFQRCPPISGAHFDREVLPPISRAHFVTETVPPISGARFVPPRDATTLSGAHFDREVLPPNSRAHFVTETVPPMWRTLRPTQRALPRKANHASGNESPGFNFKRWLLQPPPQPHMLPPRRARYPMSISSGGCSNHPPQPYMLPPRRARYPMSIKGCSNHSCEKSQPQREDHANREDSISGAETPRKEPPGFNSESGVRNHLGLGIESWGFFSSSFGS